ncbi:MAG: 4Fe-4S ferredoxin [Proteobacteria bacterium]|nr:4Fe-4S ferredoxin [Pseudomonadota bacterium]
MKGILLTGDKPVIPENTKMIPVYIMGKRYMVPETLTIQKAFEYAGYQWIRGCGCRGGICGACATVYRIMGDHKLYFGLACQTVVKEDMVLAQIPFYPYKRKYHDVENSEPTAETMIANYPEILKCVGCNTCTRACPMDIKVMDYINCAIRGDIERCAKLSLDCIMCGLCTSRCPAQITHYNVAMFARRLTGAKIYKRANHLKARVQEINSGKYDKFMKELTELSDEELKRRYVEEREWEPLNSRDIGWKPQDERFL